MDFGLSYSNRIPQPGLFYYIYSTVYRTLYIVQYIVKQSRLGNSISYYRLQFKYGITMLQKLEQKVLARLKAGKLRSIDILHPIGVTATTSHSSSDDVEKKKLPPPLVDFSSNDYLGLARSRSLFNSIEQASRDYAAKVSIDQPILGSTGSRLLTGKVQHTVDEIT